MADQMCDAGNAPATSNSTRRGGEENRSPPGQRPIALKNAAAVVFAALVFGLVPKMASAAACKGAGSDVACTDRGAVRGSTEGATLAFKGIPYAKPPSATCAGAPRSRPIPGPARATLRSSPRCARRSSTATSRAMKTACI